LRQKNSINNQKAKNSGQEDGRSVAAVAGGQRRCGNGNSNAGTAMEKSIAAATAAAVVAKAMAEGNG
jgi:hypothetical protein